MFAPYSLGMVATLKSYSIKFWLAFALILGLAGWLCYWTSISLAAKHGLPVFPGVDTEILEWARTIPDWQDMIYRTATLGFVMAVFLMLRRSWLTVFAFAIGTLMERIDWIFLSSAGASVASMLTMAAEAGGLILLFLLIRDEYLN